MADDGQGGGPLYLVTHNISNNKINTNCTS
jgi:hypothetical protein